MPTGPSCGTSWGANDRTFEGSLPDVGKTYFSNSTHKHIKLTLTVCFIVNGSSKNSMSSIMDKKII